MNKNDVIEDVEIVDYSFQGLGIGYANGKTIFVEHALKGDIVDVQITKLKKNYSFAIPLNYQRKEVDCPHYYKCGSCNMRHIDYHTQCSIKEQTLNNLMSRAKLEYPKVEFYKSPKIDEYRNKISLAAYDYDNCIKLGYYNNASYNHIPIDNCFLVSNKLNSVIKIIEIALNKVNETSYDYKQNKGNIRHVVVRESGKGDIALQFICTAGKLQNERQIVDELKLIKQIKSIVINQNNSKSRKIVGLQNRLIYGDETIDMQLLRNEFKVKANAFFQINIDITNQILSDIKRDIDFTNKNVLDAFCGTGTIGLSLATNAKHVVGIDIDKEAIESANYNSHLLDITNTNYLAQDFFKASNMISKYIFDVIIVDPPRSGLNELIIEKLVEMNAAQIIYISCDPSTLTRDLKLFNEKYKINKVTGYDMFPQTHHLETVVYLQLKDGENE